MLTSKSPAHEGLKIQEKITIHMEKDLGFKVLRLSAPISMESEGKNDLQTGFTNAEKILADTGADLLVWGDENKDGDGKSWNIYVSASVKAQCLVREAGFSIHGTSDLDQLTEGDILEVVDWVTASWEGLIGKSQGMYIPESIQPMILKTDTVLGLVAEKKLKPQTLLTVKRNLAFLLSEYGEQMKDATALQNAIRLSRDVLSSEKTGLETRMAKGDMETEGILARCLFTLGTQQMDPENLQEAVKAFQMALKGVNPKYDPDNWAVLQTGLGAALAELGQKQADMDEIQRALKAFEGAANLTSRTAQPHQWVWVQTGMGACYLCLLPIFRLPRNGYCGS
jgi:hypothetical protein